MCFWVIPSVTRVISACPLLGEFSFQKMLFSMKISFLILLFFPLLLPVLHLLSSFQPPYLSLSQFLILLSILILLPHPLFRLLTLHLLLRLPGLIMFSPNLLILHSLPNLASSDSVHTDKVPFDDPPQLSAPENPNPPQPAPVRQDNVHPMVTRAKAGIVQPRIHPSLLLVHTEPK